MRLYRSNNEADLLRKKKGWLLCRNLTVGAIHIRLKLSYLAHVKPYWEIQKGQKGEMFHPINIQLYIEIWTGRLSSIHQEVKRMSS